MMPDVQEFPIPTVVTPPDRVCVRFTIPDSQDYRQIFFGWMKQLTYWYNWQRDEGKNGITCSNLFKQSVQEMLDSLTDGCGEDDMYFRLRARPTEPRIMEGQWEPEGEWFEVLDNTCCITPVVTNRRLTADGGLEVSYDGGLTWVPDPDDPRNTVAVLPPPSGSSPTDIRCKVAQSVTASIKNEQTRLSDDAGAWGGVSGLLAILLEILVFVGIVGSGGALTPILLGLSAALLGAGKAAFDAAFTSTLYNDLQCIIFCNVKNDGTISAPGLTSIKARVGSEFTGIAVTFIVKILDAWGVPGINNAGHSGFVTDNDCSDCTCDCDISHWTVITGTELERGDDYIIAVSHFDPVGGAVICLQSDSVGQCCQVVAFAEPGSPDPHSTTTVPCGEEQIFENAVGGSAYKCCNTVVSLTPIAVSPTDNPFTMKYTFSAAEECP